MEQLRKKQTAYLIVLLSLTLMMGAAITLAIIYLDNSLISGLSLLSIIIILLLILYFKSKYDFYSSRFQYAKMKALAADPLTITKDIKIMDIKDRLEKQNYNIYLENAEYIFLYKISERTKKRKHRILYAALLFKESSYSFDDAVTNNYFASLENELMKKEKYMQRIFYQFKVNDVDDNETADNVLFVSSRKENYVFINVLVNNIRKTFYFLHSDLYYPNRYYELAQIELINIYKNKSIFTKVKNDKK